METKQAESTKNVHSLRGLEVDYDKNYFGGSGNFSYKMLLDSLQEKITRTYKEKGIHKFINVLNEDGLTRTTRLGSIELLFIKDIEHSDSIVLEVKDFDGIGLYYENHYGNSKVKKCVECGKLISNTNNKVKYCAECSVRINIQKTQKRKSLK